MAIVTDQSSMGNSDMSQMFSTFSNLSNSIQMLAASNFSKAATAVDRGEYESGGSGKSEYSSAYGETPLIEEEQLARQGEEVDTGPSKLEKALSLTAGLSAIWGDYFDQMDERKVRSDTADAEGDQKKGISTKQALGASFAMAAAHNKKIGKIYKAYAIGETIISTAKSIAKSSPNIPKMALAAANGALQLATIKGQFHSGIDSVPNSGTYLLEQGERVVDKRLNDDLKQYLTNQNNTTNNSANVSMSFGEQADPDAVNRNRSAIEQTIRDIFDEHALVSPF